MKHFFTVLILAFSLASVSAFAEQDVKPTSKPEYRLLDSIWNVHVLSLGGNTTNTLRLFELGGGDPAMNGNHLVVNLSRFPDQAMNFETGIDVYQVTVVKIERDAIVVGATEHYWLNEDIATRQAIYRIHFELDSNGAFKPMVAISKETL